MKVLQKVTSNLSDLDMDKIGNCILDEVDIDGDRKLSFVEFEHVKILLPSLFESLSLLFLNPKHERNFLFLIPSMYLFLFLLGILFV